VGDQAAPAGASAAGLRSVVVTVQRQPGTP
jgi:hypothetical protein